MCTPGDDSLLIVGTVLGSIYLYDLNEFDQSQRSDGLDYHSLMADVAALGPESEEYQDKLQQLKSRYSIQWPTFSTDGVPNYNHYSPIRKLVFI